MRLLIITPNRPDSESTFIKNQIRYLNPESILYSGYKPYLVLSKSILPFALKSEIVKKIVKNVFPYIYSKLYSQSLNKYCKENNFSIVLCNYGPQAANVVDIFKNNNIPFFVHFHGYDASVKKILERFHIKYQSLLKNSDGIISVSQDMSDRLVKLGAKSEKVFLIPYGVDIKLFKKSNPSQAANILIFIGRFTEKKSPENLLKAFKLAKNEVRDAKLVMIGEGELQDEILDCIDKFNLADSIEMHSWLSQEELCIYLHKSRAYVQHSIVAKNGDSEGTPNSILEASASGLPIISTFHAGIKEAVIHNKTGFLVNEGDWQKMGYYMVELLKNPEKAELMGNEGRKHIEINYSLELQSKKLINLLLERSK